MSNWKLKIFIFLSFVFLVVGYVSNQDVHAQTATPIDIYDDIDITDPILSVGQDESGRVCQYEEDEENEGRRILTINKAMFDTENILMGIDNPDECPLPNSNFLPDGYPQAIAAEFLLSGAICITQSIILDSMFRVYCTLVLWMFQILYAVLVVYIMFYGLAIMFDLSDEPMRQIPTKILKMVFLVFMIVNAEWGFYFIHVSFTNILNGFTEILSRVQPLYTEGGEMAYDYEGKLLDLNGNVWKGPVNGTIFRNIYGPNGGTVGGRLNVDIPDGYERVANPEEYVPYRVPAQQWTLKREGEDPNYEWNVYPVFSALNFGNPEAVHIKGPADFEYNFAGGRYEMIPRLHTKGWPTQPDINPFSYRCFKGINYVAGTTRTTCFAGGDIRDAPERLLDEDGNTQDPCDFEAAPETCRLPFQGILGKIDALFNSVVGDENAKGLSALVVALVLWGLGGGVALAFFLMLGIVSMFVAFISILWVYTTSMMGLTFMMMLAPVFLCFFFFGFTQRLARAWVGGLISFAMQPILVMGFLLVLASATTLDRLTQLSKHEIETRDYRLDMGGEDDEKVLEFSAPGFAQPLYQKPADIDQAADFATDNSPFAQVQGLITKQVRDKYRERRFKKYEKGFYADVLGVLGVDLDTNPDLLKNATQQQRDTIQLFRLILLGQYNNGLGYEYTDPITGEVENYSGPIAILYASAEFPELQRYVDAVNSDVVINEGEPDEYITGIGFDDGDAFVGEPVNGTQVVGEQPICRKYCPQFLPVYRAADAATTNPTAGQCKKYCMFLAGGQQEGMTYLMGAVMVWIILNVLTGAFITKIPRLAKMLSNAQPYSNYVPDLFGRSRTGNDDKGVTAEGGDAFSVAEKSSVYHAGGWFAYDYKSRLGLTKAGSKRADGLIPGAFASATRMFGKNGQYVDVNTGRIMTNQGNALDSFSRGGGMFGYAISGQNRSANQADLMLAEALQSAVGKPGRSVDVNAKLRKEIFDKLRHSVSGKSYEEVLAEVRALVKDGANRKTPGS